MPELSEHKVHYAEIEVPSASIKTLVATDYELLPAPGAGLVIECLAAVLTMKPAATTPTAYTWANTDHDIVITGGGDLAFGSNSNATGFLTASASARTTRVLTPAAGMKTLAENTAVKLTASGTGEPAAGTSTILVKLAYRVHDVTQIVNS